MPNRSPRSPLRRTLGAGCALLVLAGLAGPARGQDAEPDTNAVAKVFSSLKPSYSTNYSVLRQTTNWTQNFEFGSGFRFMNFTNETTFDVRTDTGRDEDRRSGSNKTSLRWLMIRKLPITTTVNLERTSVKRPGDERQTDGAQFGANTTYILRTGAVRHTFNGGAGYNQRTDTSVRNDQSSVSDDAGATTNYSWKGNWSPWGPLDLDATFLENRSSKTSTLTDETGLEETRPTNNANRTLRFGAAYDPTRWLKSTFSYSDNSGNDEYFLVQGGEGSLETKVNDRKSLTANFELKPLSPVTMTLDLSSNNHNLDYQVRKDIASAGDGNSWTGKIKVEEVLGANLDATLSSNDDELRPATSADTRTKNNLFEGELSRPMSEKISVQFNWLVRATQLFFKDENPSLILDRDELRTKLQPSFQYTPNDKWSVNVSYIGSTTRQIQLNPARATQTKEEEDFTVDMSIGYTLSERTRLSQTYSIKALYTTFDFNSRSNRLLSTQRIVTTVNSSLTPKVDLTMEHRFTLQDSGPFSFSSTGGRVFARSVRRYRQELTATVEYQLTSWFTLKTDSRFFRNDDLNELSDLRTVSRNLELRMGGAINRSLGRGMTFTADTQYIRSSSTSSYWSLVSALTKDF